MKRYAKLFLALTLVSAPVAFTSCDDSDYYDGYVYDDLVTRAVNEYFDMGGASNYFDAYNFFYDRYPGAYNDEFNAFMNAVMGANVQPYWNQYYDSNYRWDNYYNNRPTTTDNTLLNEAKALVGEWKGNVIYEYDDDQNNNQRVRDQFTADMKFFQYNSQTDQLKGSGVEVDTRENGESQTLNFTWYIADDGDIYVKYDRTGNVFVFDVQSSTEGFFIGRENGKNVDSFFGTASSKNTSDVLSIDLQRVGPSPFATSRAAGSASQSFGKSTRKVLSGYTKGAQKK